MNGVDVVADSHSLKRCRYRDSCQIMMIMDGSATSSMEPDGNAQRLYQSGRNTTYYGYRTARNSAYQSDSGKRCNRVVTSPLTFPPVSPVINSDVVFPVVKKDPSSLFINENLTSPVDDKNEPYFTALAPSSLPPPLLQPSPLLDPSLLKFHLHLLLKRLLLVMGQTGRCGILIEVAMKMMACGFG